MNRQTKRLALWSWIAAVALGAPLPAAAQEPARDAIQALIPGSSRADVDAVTSTVVAQIAGVPLGSSSGGFTYVRNARTGEVTLQAASFGPSFAERPTTLGRAGALTFGTSWQHTSFRSFEGVDLRNGDLRAELRVDGRPVQTLFSSTLDISTSTTSFFAHVGITDNVDVAVLVPWVQLSLSGARASDMPDARGQHTIFRDVETSGIGDAMVRVKWAPLQLPQAALAAAYEARLPTGDEAKLIGVAGVRSRLMFLASTTSGVVSPHVNLIYQFGGNGARVETAGGTGGGVLTGGLGRELGYTFGVEVAAHPSVTLSADIVGRSMHDVARFQFEDTPVTLADAPPNLQAVAPLLPPGRVSVHALHASVGTLDRWLLAVGAKAAILQRGLVRFDVMGSLNDAGIKPGITTVIGFEYAF
jgi:hypothetical protein